jgi:hypothetical protein
MEYISQDTQFNISTAISQPFRMPGGKRFLIKLLLWTAALFLLIYGIFGKQFISAYIEMFQNIIELEKSGALDEDDAAAIGAIMGPMMSIMGLATLIWMLSLAVMISAETAFHKNIFRGTDHGIFPLRFGKDELRVLLARLIVGIICYGVFFAAYIVAIALFVMAATMAEAPGGAAALFGLIGFLAFLAMMGFTLFILVRFSPAAALSVRDDDIRTIEGWKATKNKFWPMIACYLIVGFAGYIILSVFMTFGVFAIFADGSLIELFSSFEGAEDPAVIFGQIGDAFKRPTILIPLLIISVLYMIGTLLWYFCFWGIPSYAAQLDALETGRDQ